VANMLTSAVDWLNSQLQDYASQTVTYRRPATGQSVSLSATYGRQLLSVTDRAGHVKVERADRDFIFPAASLILGGLVVTPQKGDTVTLANGDVFEVTPMGLNEPEWKYSDPFQTMIRVHCKAIA
jgi:hypothetical protein